MGPDVVPERFNVVLLNYFRVGLLIEFWVVFANDAQFCEVELLVAFFEVFGAGSLEGRNEEFRDEVGTDDPGDESRHTCLSAPPAPSLSPFPPVHPTF